MQELANSLIDNAIQCWACPVFDNLFAIISNVAAAAYQRLCLFSVVIFCILFAFYTASIAWNHIKNGGKDSLFEKNLRPVLIKSLVALSLLSMGLIVPQLISKITFEPVAFMTLKFSQLILPDVYVAPAYDSAIQLGNNGFFDPELRDTIMKLLETSVANFQVYIKYGIEIVNSAFSFKALLGISALVRHMIICLIGLFLTYNFVNLFIKYSFCFMDIIFAMAMFAFFFPLSVVLFIFKDANNIPGWMKNLGSNLGGGQIKKLINAIVSVISTILTYTIIMLVINGFIKSNLPGGLDPNSIDKLYSINTTDFVNATSTHMTLASVIVLVYVIRYIADQLPKVTEKILSIFNVQQENALSKEMGENVFKLTSIVANKTKEVAQAIISPKSTKTDKGEEGTKDEKTK